MSLRQHNPAPYCGAPVLRCSCCSAPYSIFIGSDDIRNQLPQEAKRFDTIDKSWLKIMADTARNTNVLDACSTDGR